MMALTPVTTGRKNKFTLCMNLHVAALALLPLSLAAQTTQPAFTVAPATAATLKAGQQRDRKSTRLNSSHSDRSRMPSSA